MRRFRAIQLSIPLTILLIAVAACETDRPGDADNDLTASAPTITSPVAKTPTPTPTPTPLVGEPPIVTVEIVSAPERDPAVIDLSNLSAEQILATAESNFLKSDSYLADVFVTHFLGDRLGNDETIASRTLIEFGPNLLAHTIETSDETETEHLYVRGFSYSRPHNQPDHPWFVMGRERLDAVRWLNMFIGGIGNPQLVATREENGRTLVELTGSFHLASSGPPAITFKRVWKTSSSIVIDADLMLPVSVAIEYISEFRDLETDELLGTNGLIGEATISAYGQVVVHADHPTDLVPTPVPPPPATPTPSPTPLSAEMPGT